VLWRQTITRYWEEKKQQDSKPLIWFVALSRGAYRMPPPPAALSIIWKRTLCGEITTATPPWCTLPCHHMRRKAAAIGSTDHLLPLTEGQLGEPGFLLPSDSAGTQTAFALQGISSCSVHSNSDLIL